MKKKELDELEEEKKELKKYNKKKKERDNLRTLEIKKTLIISVIFIFSLIMLVFFCNRTFFKTNYKTSKVDIDIPRLLFFIKDDGNEIVFKTYRKSQYVRDYFDNHLYNLTLYRCKGKEFYYDDENNTAFYSINVEKGIALKTVTIKYAVGDADCLCLSGLEGKEAEEFCKNNK